MTKIKLALPKGSLEEATYEFFSNAGYKIRGTSRTYRPKISDSNIEIKILRPQEIPVLVSEGSHDLGISGDDWILENNATVTKILNLEYGKIKIVVATSKSNSCSNFSELVTDYLKNNKPIRISTEYLNIAKDYVMKNPNYKERFGSAEPVIITPWWKSGSNELVKIYLSFGATEAKPPEDADVIFDVTETGSTLDKNNLKIIDVILESEAKLIVNNDSYSDPEKRVKIFDILSLLRGVVEGRKHLHIFLNVKKENLPILIKNLPALQNPTVSELTDPNWCSLNTVIAKKDFLKILPKLRELSQGLVVHKPMQILPLEELSKDEKK